MRVNVYAEELTERIELITKVVPEPGDPYGVKDHTFYGLRFWLKFPNQPWWVHRKASSPAGVDDDDSSAITLWAPSREALQDLLMQALGVTQTDLLDEGREGDDR